MRAVLRGRVFFCARSNGQKRKVVRRTSAGLFMDVCDSAAWGLVKQLIRKSLLTLSPLAADGETNGEKTISPLDPSHLVAGF